MNERQRRQIILNIHYLCDNTGNIPEICLYMISNSHMDITDYQEIMAKVTDREKCIAMYTKLQQRPSFDDLIDSLNNTPNSHVAKRLLLGLESSRYSTGVAGKGRRPDGLQETTRIIAYFLKCFVLPSIALFSFYSVATRSAKD